MPMLTLPYALGEQQSGGGGGLTPAQAAKLAGIQAGAQVNPKHIIPALRAIDGNNNLAGIIQFIDESNTEVQTGSSDQIAAIAIPAALCSSMEDPETDTGTTTDHHSFLTDTAVNGGSLIITIARILYDADDNIIGVSASEVMVIQCERTVANQDGSYALQQLKHLKAIDLTGISTGTGWQLAAGETNPIGADALIGLWQQTQIDNYTEWVKRAELAGHESDFYLSYNNAFVANPYRSGDWVLTTDPSGPPTTANQIGQPDIESGSGIVAFAARTRSDADPNNLQWNPASVATDYSSGDVIYASLPRDKGSHLKITLTSGGTLVGTDDAAYIWATADWVEVGNIANVQDAGDYFTLSDFEPSALRVRLPVQDILGAVDVDGTNVTDALKAAIQGKNEAKTLTEKFRVDVSNVDYYVQITLADDLNPLNTMRIRIPSTDDDTEIDKDLKRLLLPHAWVRVGGYVVDITSNATRSKLGTSITYAFNFLHLMGTQPTGSTPVSLRVIGEDVHRGELLRFCFEDEDWEDVLTEIGEVASDDVLLIWDKSAQQVKRVFRSALNARETLATGLSQLSSGTKAISLTSTQETAIKASFYAGKNIVVEQRNSENTHNSIIIFESTGITSGTVGINVSMVMLVGSANKMVRAALDIDTSGNVKILFQDLSDSSYVSSPSGYTFSIHATY